MLRILLPGLLIAIIALLMIFKVRSALKFLATIFYSRISPLGMSGSLPLWARYYLSSEDYEGPPPGIGQLEETVKLLGVFIGSNTVGIGGYGPVLWIRVMRAWRKRARWDWSHD